MGFSLSDAFASGGEWLYASPLGGAIRNPLITALLITVLAMTIIFAVYRQTVSGGWRRAAKSGFWVLVATSALLSVHYYAVRHDLKKRSSRESADQVFAAVEGSQVYGGRYDVLNTTADFSDLSDLTSPDDHRDDYRSGYRGDVRRGGGGGNYYPRGEYRGEYRSDVRRGGGGGGGDIDERDSYVPPEFASIP